MRNGGVFSWFTSPRGRTWSGVFLLFLLLVVTASYDAPEHANRALDAIRWPWGRVPVTAYRLGLDLKGGTRLVYEADVTKVPAGDQASALEGARDVIERRVNAFGVAEPLIQTATTGGHSRLIVELAGIQDISQAIKLIGETPLLQFKEQKSAPTQTELTADQKKQLADQNAAAKKKADQALADALKSGADFAKVYEQYNEAAGIVAEGGDIGFIKESDPSNGELVKQVKSDTRPLPFVYNKVIEQSVGYSIVKVEEKRTTDKEVSARHILICFKGAQSCTKETSKEDALKKANELKAQATAVNFVELAKAHSTEPGADKGGGDLGFFAKGAMVKPFEDAIWGTSVGSIVGPVETQFGYHVIHKTLERLVPEYHLRRIGIGKRTTEDILGPQDQFQDTGLGGKQLKRAAVEFDPNTGEPLVNLQFDDEGAKLFADITKKNVGKPLAIFLDNQPISIPTVNTVIEGGSAVITGNFTIPEAKTLAQRLNAGALPVPITLLSQQLVGASLGAESISKSLYAGIAGLLAIIVFMVVLYRLPGFLASLSLLLYTAVLMAIFKAWPITLTFAGISGVLLSIGMAVDANILIFERMKEELRWGRALDDAMREGFSRAWTSIRDSNLSSLITCVILYSFSSSNIRGFAVTLAIGIFVSLFSAITVTRTLLRWAMPWTRNHHWLFGVKKI